MDKRRRKMMKSSMKKHMASRFGATAGSWLTDCNAFIARDVSPSSRLNSGTLLSWAASNSTLLSYLYDAPPNGGINDVRVRWHAMTEGCRIEPLGCWCFHVPGSMVKAANPHGAKQCAPKDHVLDCTNPASGPYYVKAHRNCSCFAQAPPPSPPCPVGINQRRGTQSPTSSPLSRKN